MLSRSDSNHIDLDEDVDLGENLQECARTLAGLFSRSLPVHELRPEVREEVARLCRYVLGTDAAPGPNEELVFESLQAVTLQSVVQACLGRSLPLDRLVSRIDVEQLTEVLIEAEAPGQEALLAMADPDPASRFEPFPLTDVQQAYLLGRDSHLELGNVTSTCYAELETVDVDLDRLEAALNDMVIRHDALRTIVLPDGYQQVLPRVERYAISREDLRDLSPGGREARLQAIRRELDHRAFQPQHWPLFELRASRLDERHVRLHLAIDLLITDGTSIGRLLSELSERYVDPGRVWPGLEVSFRDYQVAVGGLVGSARFERARGYWLGRLGSLPAAPELPLAVALSAVAAPRFSQRSFVLEPAGWAGLRSRASRHGLTASSVLAAAYAAVLGQWARSPRFTLNVTVNGRLPLHRQVNEVLGDFTALSLLEVDAPAGETFLEFADRLQRRLWTDLDHREFSGVRVLRELARQRGTTAAAMPVVFSTYLGAGLNADFSPAWLEDIPYVLAKAPQMTMEALVYEFRGGLVLSWDVVEKVFPPGVVDAMFEAYRALVHRLAGSVGAWRQPVGCLTPPAQLAVRAAVNDTTRTVEDRLLHQVGTFLAERGPSPAVIAGSTVLSYRDLDRTATRIAARLRQLDAHPDHLVAIVMTKGWQQIVAALAVLYSGAAYLPIDATLPPARIRHLLDLGRVHLALTQTTTQHVIDWPTTITTLPVDDPTTLTTTDDTPLPSTTTPDNLAYVIFTSGSTGEPKGVMIDHRGAANTITDINTRYHLTPTDRVLALSALSFDLSVWDIFGTLAAGGTIIIPDNTKDPQHWTDLINTHHITIWNTVPALMDMLITHTETNPTTTLHNLRLIMLSGDWIPTTLPDRIRNHTNPTTNLISLGGATEASIWSIAHPITTIDPTWPSIPYGTPLTNQTCHILDHNHHHRPDWVTGHIHIAGTGLARGYWHDPDRTTTAFPHHPTTGQRLYHTGDLGRYHPDGTIEILGREDNQVKINGYRIELGEIDTTINQHPNIKNTITTTHNNHLTTYITLHPPTEAEHSPDDSADQVRQWAGVFDGLRDTYVHNGRPADFDTTGWISSFTGEPVADADMLAWVEQTVERIQAFRPERVLEIGCGTGLIGIRLARQCRNYVGTDISAKTLAALRRSFDALGPAVPAEVTLLETASDELRGVPDGAFDCVVVNSVSQYFPGRGYLHDTVLAAMRKLAPRGVLFFGDVRDLRFLPTFHAAVEVAHTGPDDPAEAVAFRMTQRGLGERELAVDPSFFASVTRAPVAILPRGGSERTEMADYRYDAVILSDRAARDPLPGGPTLHWTPDGDLLPEVAAALRGGAQVVRVTGIPNARLLRDASLAERLATVSGHEASTVGEVCSSVTRVCNLRPDDFATLAREHGYRHEAWYPARQRAGWFDVVIWRDLPPVRIIESIADSATTADTSDLTNDPATARRSARVRTEVVAHAARHLPEYMVPDEIIVLPELPLSANGKVERSRLPRPDRALDREGRPGRAPATQLEHVLAAIWGGLLVIDQVTVDSDFFRSGGDSLSAVRLISAARAAGLRLRPGDLFAHPTIAQLAELAARRALGKEADDDDVQAEQLPAVRPDPASRFEPFALTEIQQAYLLGRTGYFELGNVPASFYVELEALDLDVRRLTTALNATIARHGALRTVVTEDGMQRELAEVPDLTVDVLDCAGMDPEKIERQLAEVRAAMTARPFDPGSWPLLDVRATRLDERRTRLHVVIDLLVADGASVNLLLSELSERYVDPGRVWPGLEVSFRDYQVAVGGLVGSARFERARGYWLGRLGSLPAAPELPLAVALSAVAAPRFSQRSFVLEPAGWAGLRSRASRHGLTASSVLAAAYAAVLGQWARSPRFTLNVTVNGRLPLHRQVNEVLGDFTALSLLEVDAPAGETFLEFADRLQRRLWTDLDHREFSGVRVLRELARQRGTTAAAMPVVFSTYLGAGLNADFSPAWLEDIPYVLAKAPQMTMEALVYEFRGGLVLSWDVVEKVFPPGVVDAMFEAYRALVHRLAGSVGAWRQPVGCLTPPAQLAVRAAVNDTTRTVEDRLLHQVGTFLAERGPSPAVIAGSTVLSYRDLDRTATRIAARLRQLDAHPDHLVAIVMTKGWQQIVAALAVLYSGAAYLPIDATLPPARIRHLLDLGRVHLALTQTTTQHVIDWPTTITTLPVDDPTTLTTTDDTPLPSTTTPDNLAYVIFTSGSTGEPKGVMIDHRGAANTITDINTRYHLTPTDRVLALSALSFDLSVWDIFGTLAAGGTIIIPDNTKDPQHWTDLINTHHITIWNTVPALMDMLITHTETNPTTTLHNLRLIMLSGDWIPTTLPDRIRNHTNPTTNLISLGGATEASIWSIAHPITTIDPTWPSIPYGTPLTNQTCHILDHNHHHRPDWVTGHIHIAGTGLARGYWHDPDRTTTAFPHHPTTGQRLYHTGDLGRYHPDGTIEILGREDNQVKINGYRIELGEIDTTINQHPNIKNTITTTHNNHLTTYITLHPSAGYDDPQALYDEVLDLCRGRLPDWMVPARVILLDELPLSPNGKVDRAALPVPDAEPLPHGHEVVAPRSDVERLLHGIWSELLGHEAFGVLDNFAAVGGDSLLALQVINRAAARGLRISPRDFFAHPAIADLAEYATSEHTGPATDRPAGDGVGRVPLTPRQAAFLSAYPDPPAHWNYTMLFDAVRPLDRTALGVALRAALRHHDGLRISFRREPDWTASIAPATNFPLPLSWFDLTGVPEPQRPAVVEGTCRELQASISLEGPLLQVGYFRAGARGQDQLFVVGHWLLWDNYSCRIFLEDLLAGHDQAIAEGEVFLPPSTPLATWADRLAEAATAVEVAGELEYWRRLVARPVEPLPRDRAGRNDSGSTRTVIGALGTAATAAMTRSAELESTPVADILLAAAARALARWGGTPAVRVDVDGHGRNRTDLDVDPSRTIGRLSVRRPIHVAAPDAQHLLQLARSVSADRTAAAMDGANFDLLAHVVGDEPLRTGRAEVLFNYLGRVDSLLPADRLRLADEDPGPPHGAGAEREHLIEILCGSLDGDTLLAATYSANCHHEHTVRALVFSALDDIRQSLGAPVPADTWALPALAAPICHLLA
jgi:amino acid adenylation domain-containing protein